MVELNWIAIILAAVSTMIVGSIWYGPLFGKAWTKLAKVKKDSDFGGMKAVIMYGGAFLGSLITAIVLALAIFIFHDFKQGNLLVDALMTGLLLWLGFTATRIHMHDSFEGRRKKLTLLSISNELVTIEVMALIIGLLPA
jgi:large-conductance mechanosensitive channel